jgi:3,4-dihydroxy 2-butanone 4-phosphate synthase/GTP cyclohydrolase II
MINTTDEILLSIKNGEMVIIMDDENRENEGDLVMASQFVKPSDINFMASEGRGLICLTLTESRCKT